jgi:hypothetical protein
MKFPVENIHRRRRRSPRSVRPHQIAWMCSGADVKPSFQPRSIDAAYCTLVTGRLSVSVDFHYCFDAKFWVGHWRGGRCPSVPIAKFTPSQDGKCDDGRSRMYEIYEATSTPTVLRAGTAFAGPSTDGST